jgi:Holliday junction resolvase RusA-like endonuclease
VTVGDSLLTDEILSMLVDPNPDLGRLRRLIVEAYAVETGEAVDPLELTESLRDAIADWLRSAFMENERFVGFFGKPNTLRAIMFDGLESKISWLHQAPCTVCGVRTDFPVSLFHLRVSPRSQQAQPAALRRAFRRAIAAGLDGRGIHQYREGQLCVRLVYLLASKRRDKIDVDNLTKGTLDALRGVVFDDDSQIAHLDLVKVRGTGDDEFIAVRIQPTALNDHETDTFRQTLQVSWAGAQMLNLDDYLED